MCDISNSLVQRFQSRYFPDKPYCKTETDLCELSKKRFLLTSVGITNIVDVQQVLKCDGPTVILMTGLLKVLHKYCILDF